MKPGAIQSSRPYQQKHGLSRLLSVLQVRRRTRSMRPQTGRSGPDETAAVVVDNDDQVAVPPFVGDLIDPDPTQTSEAVDSGLDVIVDPCDDRPTVRHATRNS